MSLLYTNNKDDDIVNMIAAEVHVGTQNCNSQMESYIYDRTRDGVFYLDLAKTWEKTMVAARIIAAIQEKNKKDVLVSALFLSLSIWSCFLFLKLLLLTNARFFSRLFPPVFSPREPCSSLPLIPAPTTWVESGSQAH